MTAKDIIAMAAKLGISEQEMRKRYVRNVGGRKSLVERKPSNDCIFLTEDTNGQRGCRVYFAHPIHCKTWPFWFSNVSSPNAWALAGVKCKGINRGQLVEPDQIDTQVKATSE